MNIGTLNDEKLNGQNIDSQNCQRIRHVHFTKTVSSIEFPTAAVSNVNAIANSSNDSSNASSWFAVFCKQEPGEFPKSCQTLGI